MPRQSRTPTSFARSGTVEGALERGERLALVEVVEVHRLPDAPGNARLAAEHVGDRLPEKVARGIVRVFVRLGPPEGSHLVAAVSHHDGVPDERTGARAAVARDRLFVARLHLLLGELHELVILRVVKIDSHVEPPFYSESAVSVLSTHHPAKGYGSC